jgi:hypothetical protein
VAGQGRSWIARRALACACLGALGLAPRVVVADPADAPARAIFDALRVGHDLEEIAAEAETSVAEPARQLPAADALLLRAAVATCFDPERLDALALDTFSAHLDPQYAPAALGWLERPETQSLLQRVAGPETTGMGSPAPGAAPDPEADAVARDALLLRFERESGHRARAERHAGLVFAAMLRAANPLLPPFQRYSDAEVDSMARTLRARLAAGRIDPAELRQRYAGIPSESLEEALAFLESPAGTWLRRELDAALERALVGAASATAAHLVGLLGDGAPRIPVEIARQTP